MFENVTSRYDMSDATIEIVIMLLVAFLLGALLGYFLCRQCCEEDAKEEAERNSRLTSHDDDDGVRVTSRDNASASSGSSSTMNLAGSGAATATTATVVDEVEDAVDDTARGLTGSVSAAENKVEEVVADAAEEVEEEISDDWKPAVLDAPIDGKPDDLKRISGVGPVIEKTLNELGIFHYKQISDLDGNNVKWLDNYIAFPGRITRENWIGQSKDLMAGVATDFADRYDAKK